MSSGINTQLDCGLIHCFPTRSLRTVPFKIPQAPWPEQELSGSPCLNTLSRIQFSCASTPETKELRPEVLQDWDKEMALRPREDALLRNQGLWCPVPSKHQKSRGKQSQLNRHPSAKDTGEPWESTEHRRTTQVSSIFLVYQQCGI